MTLKGKVALVTGSTSGIGLGIARALAAQGATIALNGLGEPVAIEKIRSELATEFGVSVSFVGGDLTKTEAVEAMIRSVERAHGSLDILVNNAGMQHVSPIEDFPPEKYDLIVALNLSATFHAIRLAVPGMKKRGWGRIINIASAHALVASPFKSAYVATKHAVLGLTKTVALEVAECGVTVNAICPGYVLTPLVEKQIPDTAKARGMTEEQVIRDVLLAAQATKKFVEVDELGALAVFLCSDGARSMTGTALPVDGAWTAH
ncbi:3-hydroxybutyrate dehydrogenase [Uliginosibacterium sp. 31-12]|uniref:3-hydroxybutyrate dehydrogenase n=1 Tax=Uliginosibacterium sp. 31-12 TaxID=3062781 RepID=UPI0026E1EB9B|nr:3-hydroxybutyrate dehydrogenase [Uliginosibacterium sp. 31-12]MDO6385943.1 3-hydroxybutyrate dehydrogenase [Uliginosibacterium sp. 31-12]